MLSIYQNLSEFKHKVKIIWDIYIPSIISSSRTLNMKEIQKSTDLTVLNISPPINVIWF